MQLQFLAFLLSIASIFANDRVEQIESIEKFDAFLEEADITMVEFYAPWCGHCKKLLPEFEKAAEMLEADNIKLGKVDCTTDDNTPLCKRFGVNGYPTIKFFSNGKDSDYNGGRIAADIHRFIKSRSGPAISVLENEEQAKKFTTIDDGLVIIEFAEEISEDIEKRAASMVGTVDFGSVSDSAIAESLGATIPSVVMFRSFDEPVVVYEGDSVASEQFAEWIEDSSFPLVGEIGPENYKKYMDRGLPLMWLAIKIGDSETTSLLETMTDLAAEFKGVLSVVQIDGVQFESHVKNLGYEGDLPGIIITDKSAKYLHHEKTITKESVSEFMTGFRDKTIDPFIKSAEPPEENDESVLIVVGKTFNELVIENDKDVLVEFYAPWCGHCKKLEPEYNDLGERFSENEKIVIAKMDSTENDGPVEVSGFPTIYFFSSKDKSSPIKYTGGRTADDLEQYLLENAPNAKDSAGHDEL